MTEKRFTPRLEHNRIVWITDTVEEKILFGEDTVGLLNMLHEENEKLKRELTSLRVELDTHRHPLWSTREAERKVKELVDNLADMIEKNTELYDEVNRLRIENMRLRELRKYER